MIEFAIGAIICSEMDTMKNNRLSKYLFSWFAFIVEYIVLIVGVTIAVNMNISA